MAECLSRREPNYGFDGSSRHRRRGRHVRDRAWRCRERPSAGLGGTGCGGTGRCGACRDLARGQAAESPPFPEPDRADRDWRERRVGLRRRCQAPSCPALERKHLDRIDPAWGFCEAGERLLHGSEERLGLRRTMQPRAAVSTWILGVRFPLERPGMGDDQIQEHALLRRSGRDGWAERRLAVRLLRQHTVDTSAPLHRRKMAAFHSGECRADSCRHSGFSQGRLGLRVRVPQQEPGRPLERSRLADRIASQPTATAASGC